MFNTISNQVFYTLGLYDIWNMLDNQQKETLTEAINIGIDEGIKQVKVEPKLYALYNFCIKILVKYHLWRSSKFRIAPKGYTEKQADDIWWKHNSKTQTLIEKLKRI